jgi:hypothetical protein
VVYKELNKRITLNDIGCSLQLCEMCSMEKSDAYSCGIGCGKLSMLSNKFKYIVHETLKN